MGVLDALFDPQFRKDVVRGALDAVNRGAVAGTLGGPVDLATMALRPLGYTEEKPVMGSEWIGDKLRRLGLVTDNRNPVAEALASVAIPGALSRAAPAVFAAEQRAAQNMMQPSPMNAATRGQAGAIVWHGSPHKFDKFDSSKIGTGEGAQAYGHGLYLAENPGVAKEYRDKLATGQLHLPDGSVFNPFDHLKNPNVRAALQNADGDIAAAVNRANGVIKAIPNTEGAQLAAQDLIKLQELQKVGGLSRPQGSLYKVDLPDDQIARMLDWDKPLSQQPKAVQSFVESMKEAYPATYGEMINSQYGGPLMEQTVGRDLHRFLGNSSEFLGVDRGAMLSGSPGWANSILAEKIKQQGIPGIQYLDGGSRGAGTGTRNYVVFPGEEDILQILERNGAPITGGGR